MHRDLAPEAVTTIELDCPGCGAPMEIFGRFTLYGVPAPVEHVKVRCAVGHWYTIPTDWLARRHHSFQNVAARQHRQSVTPFFGNKLPSLLTTARHPRATHAGDRHGDTESRVPRPSANSTPVT